MTPSAVIPPEAQLFTESWSAALGVDARTVRSRTLLNLLRFDTATAADADRIKEEIRKAAHRAALRSSIQRWRLRGPSPDRLESNRATFHAVDNDEAEQIIEAFHFLGYARPFGSCFGVSLREGGTWRLAAVLSASPCDLDYVRPLLGSAADDALVVTRLYSMPWAPRNTLTFLLGSVRRHLRKSRIASLLLTFCNPNAGHRGATYSAAGWNVFARQRQHRLYYVDGDYISIRQTQGLNESDRRRVTESRQPLHDLLIFCRAVDDRLERVLARPPHGISSPALPELEIR